MLVKGATGRKLQPQLQLLVELNLSITPASCIMCIEMLNIKQLNTPAQVEIT